MASLKCERMAGILIRSGIGEDSMTSGDVLVKFALAAVMVVILAGVQWTVKWWGRATKRARLWAVVLWAVLTMGIYVIGTMFLG